MEIYGMSCVLSLSLLVPVRHSVDCDYTYKVREYYGMERNATLRLNRDRTDTVSKKETEPRYFDLY